MPKVGFWKLYGITQILQMKSGEQRAYSQGFFHETQYLASFSFTILNDIGIHPLETVIEQGGSPWRPPPKSEKFMALVLTTSQPVISGSSKPGRWHFILGPLGRDRISQGEQLHSAQYREVVNCLYGPTSPGRARRHLCVKTLHPGGGKKNTKKIKREKYRIK